MKQMTKDEMMKLYFRTVNEIIALAIDFTRLSDTDEKEFRVDYQRKIAKK